MHCTSFLGEIEIFHGKRFRFRLRSSFRSCIAIKLLEYKNIRNDARKFSSSHSLKYVRRLLIPEASTNPAENPQKKIIISFLGFSILLLFKFSNSWKVNLLKESYFEIETVQIYVKCKLYFMLMSHFPRFINVIYTKLIG